MHGIASNKGFKKALIAAFLVAMMVVGPLGALQRGSAATASTTRDGGMYLKVAMQDDVKTLNPLSAGDVWTWNVIGWVFDGLVWRNNTNNDHIEPWAAEWFHHGNDKSTWDMSVGYPDNDKNNDFRNWTVKLRPDVRWHDWTNHTGDDRYVRPHDVIFSLRLVADVPRYMGSVECIVARNADDGSIMYGSDLPANGTIQLINYENGKVTKLPYWVDLSSQKKYPNLPVVYVWEDSNDNLTLHYFTTYQYVDFTIDTLGALIFPERLWSSHIDDKLTWSGPGCLINFGPFKFDYWDKTDQRSQISTFRDYFHTQYDKEGNPKPYIDGVQFVVYRSTDVAIQALQSGTVDYIAWTIDPSYIDTIQQDPHLTLVRNSDLGFFYVAFNMRDSAMGYAGYDESDTGTNPKYTGNYTDVGKPFRVAVAHLIDKQTVVQTYLHGYGTVGTSVVSPSNTLWYNPNIKIYGFDPDKANQILDANGYKDKDGDGWRNIGDLGNQITLMTPPADYDPIRQQAGQLIQTDAQSDANLNIQAVPTQFGTIVDKINQHDFQMYMLGWSIPTPLSSATAPCDFFSSKYDVKNGGNNYPGYHNKTFDELCDQMQREANQTKRINIAFQLQDAIAEDVPYVVLYYRDVLEAYNNRFQGWVSRYGTIFNWYSLQNIKPQIESTYQLSMSVPSSVTTGNSFDISAQLINKDSYKPISGVNISFSVSLNGNETSLSAVATDEYGKATVTYTAPSVENQTTLTVKASVYDESTKETITQIKKIVILPQPPVEYEINMNIQGIPANHLVQIDSGKPIPISIQITNASSGEPIGELNETTTVGARLSIDMSPATGGSMDYFGYSDGKFNYVFTGSSPENTISEYIVTITAEYVKDNSTLSTTNGVVQFIVKGPVTTTGGGGTGGGTTTGNNTTTGGGTTTGNGTSGGTGGGTGGGTTTGNNTTTGGNNNGGGTGGNNNGGGTGGGNNNGGGSTPSIGIIPVIISVGIAAIAYSEYRRKKKE